MSQNTERSSRGIGVVGLLGVVFVTLKLCGVINWSWWWVTLPFWGGAAAVLMIVVIGATVLTWVHRDKVKKR